MNDTLLSYPPLARKEMEIMGEFDNESPLYVTFCTRVSPEDFERQSLTYTQKCLQDLYAKMEQNPIICETVVRKRKQLMKEKAGLASYLKTKFLTMFNYNTPLDIKEIEKEVVQLKQEMQRASSYATAAKRSSQWMCRPRKSRPLGGFNSTMNRTIPAMPRIFGPYPPQVERSTGGNTDLGQSYGGMSSARQRRTVDLHPVCSSSSVGSSNFGRLTTNSFPSFPSTFSPTSPFESAGPSTSTSTTGTSSGLRPPTAVRPRTEDKMENENPGPSSPSRGP